MVKDYKTIPYGSKCGIVYYAGKDQELFSYYCPYWSRPCVDRHTTHKVKANPKGHCALMKVDSVLLYECNKVCGINIKKPRKKRKSK